MTKADIIIHGGNIFPGKDISGEYDYITVKDRRIQSMGSGSQWKEFLGEHTQVIELDEDELVVPGFHDSHLHMLMAALNYNFVNLIDASSEEEAAEMVWEFSKKISDDEWVIGVNWYHMNWPGRKLPTKKTLDRYFPERPVYLTNTEVHGAWVNSKALEIIGITDDTPDPPNGEIVRDDNGEATGYLNEMAMGLAGRVAMKFPLEREMELIGKVAHTFASKGVTAVQDMRPELGYDLGQYEAFARLAQRGELNVRVHSAANLLTGIDEILEKGEKFNSDVFRICLLKQYMDGVPTTHTAMVADGYKDRPGYKGSPINDPEKMRLCAEEAHRRGLSVRIHCCGDGAVSKALDIYEGAVKKYGHTASRHAIEHVEIIQQRDIQRFRELGIIASMQPEHMVSQVERCEDNPYLDKYTEKQLESAWILRTLLDNKVRVAFGTDCPVVSIDPLINVYRAVTRKFNNGKPLDYGADQRITVAEAIHCYTLESAFAVGRDHELGTLEPGKYADMAVLDRNILKVDPEQIKETRVKYTIMNGRVTYEG